MRIVLIPLLVDDPLRGCFVIEQKENIYVLIPLLVDDPLRESQERDAAVSLKS